VLARIWRLDTLGGEHGSALVYLYQVPHHQEQALGATMSEIRSSSGRTRIQLLMELNGRIERMAEAVSSHSAAQALVSAHRDRVLELDREIREYRAELAEIDALEAKSK